MTPARAPWLLAIGLAALILPTFAWANETQRLIVDAGLNLGLWQAQIELYGAPATDPAQAGYATNAFAAVDAVRQRLRPPFADLDLGSVLDAIARHPERTAGWSAGHRAGDVAQIHDRYRARLAVAYLSTAGVYATPTCDAAFLDVGYHLGRAQMAAFAGDDGLRANARSMLLQAIRAGLDAARHLGCGFNLEGVWGDLGVAEARSLADYQALVEPIRRTAEEAWALGDPDAPLVPSDPPRDQAPPVVAGDLEGTWRFPETGIRIEFRADGEAIVGTLHDLDADLRAVGHTEGMEAYRLRADGDGGYVGAALVILSYQTFAWREELRVTVAGDVARFEERWDMGRANPYEARREP